MNRLTKHISLVLISSSLVLHGCAEPDDEDQPQQPAPPGSSGSTGLPHGQSGYHGGSHFWGVPHSGWGSGSRGTGPSSTGGSSRGGFGGSSHGAGS